MAQRFSRLLVIEAVGLVVAVVAFVLIGWWSLLAAFAAMVVVSACWRK